MPVPYNFQLFGVPNILTATALGKYHRYWNDQGAKVRNPEFDKHCSYILSLKDPTNREFKEAVSYFVGNVGALLKRNPDLPGAEFLIVPSCTAGKVSTGLERVVEGVCGNDKRFSYRRGSLRRISSIHKLARGGDRSLVIQNASIAYESSPRAPLSKWLLDDVTTTGNSLIACAAHVAGVEPRATLRVLVLGKTHG